MKLRSLVLAAMVLIGTSALAGDRKTYNCPSGKVVVGDSSEGVLARCGTPQQIFIGVYDSGVLAEIWYYEFGHTRVSFEFDGEGEQLLSIYSIQAKGAKHAVH